MLLVLLLAVVTAVGIDVVTLLSLSNDVAVDTLAVPPVLAAAAVVVVDDVVVGVVVAVVIVVIVVIVAAWGTDTCTASFCSCVSARACWSFGPRSRVQALSVFIEFTAFLAYRINLGIDLGFVGGSFGQLSSPPRTFHLRSNSPSVFGLGIVNTVSALTVGQSRRGMWFGA